MNDRRVDVGAIGVSAFYLVVMALAGWTAGALAARASDPAGVFYIVVAIGIIAIMYASMLWAES